MLLLDQRPHGKAVIAPFFGRPARCERGAAVLLRRLEMPVLVGACYTTDVPYRYKISFPTVIAPGELSGASPEAIVGRVNAEMEALILRHPEQYFWLHDRFRDAPTVAASLWGTASSARPNELNS
jgi:KDO2-lipid IV(A) lauroyltransferase